MQFPIYKDSFTYKASSWSVCIYHMISSCRKPQLIEVYFMDRGRELKREALLHHQLDQSNKVCRVNRIQSAP